MGNGSLSFQHEVLRMQQLKFPSFSVRTVFEDTVEVVRGKLDIISISLTVYLLLFMVVFATWEKLFPQEFSLLQNLCWLTVIGFMLHLMVCFAIGAFPSFDIIHLPSKESRTFISLVGFGFSGVVLVQFAVISLLTAKPNVVSMETIPQLFLGAGSGIAEEWIFAWGMFTFLYWITMSRPHNLIPVMLSNAIVFALCHSAMGFMFYQGRAEFLPVIFASRLVIDASYYYSGGRLSVAMLIHILVNVSRSLVMLPIGGG
jgi:hypothetical protein